MTLNKRQPRRPKPSGGVVNMIPKAMSYHFGITGATPPTQAARGRTPSVSIKKSVSAFINELQEEKAMSAAPIAPIEADKFMTYYQERKRKRILFKGEYLAIKREAETDLTTEHAQTKENVDKNQYPDVLPYDHSRVVLPLVPGDAHSDYTNASYVDTKEIVDNNQYPDVLPYDHSWVMLPLVPGDAYSDYINASYVDSFYRPQAYVVTQSMKTKQSTVDFWRMVYDLNCNCVVMLTKVFDYMRVMCLQYWPLTKFLFGDILVETLETKTYAHFEEGVEPRYVDHFHFIEWELDSFPYISAFLELRRRIKNYIRTRPSDGPLIVHCSSGSQRCGSFLAMDANLEMIEKENVIDVMSYCRILDSARPHLLESLDQYVFIYDVIAEYVQCKFEPFHLEQLQMRSDMYKSKQSRQAIEIQDTHEFKLLCHLTPPVKIGECAGGHRLENRGKNRDVMVVPPDTARPYLQTLHGESKDYTYINAVHVDGYTRKEEWIVTEWPKPETVDSLWALVFDHNCHTIVNLSNQGNPKHYPEFIHNRGRQIYGPFVVEVLSYHNYPYMTSHMVRVMKRTFMISEIMASGNKATHDAETRICCVISVKMWPIENRVPLSTAGLIDVIKMARSWRKRAPDRPDTKPSIVISHNGVSRVGIYIAANACIDQMDMDGEVDVFHAVKMIRINRPQLVDRKDEYKYLHDLILHYFITNPDYNQDIHTAEENHT